MSAKTAVHRDLVGLLLGSSMCCLTSIEAHIGEVTPSLYKELQGVYDKLLAIQQVVAGITNVEKKP